MTDSRKRESLSPVHSLMVKGSPFSCHPALLLSVALAENAGAKVFWKDEKVTTKGSHNGVSWWGEYAEERVFFSFLPTSLPQFSPGQPEAALMSRLLWSLDLSVSAKESFRSIVSDKGLWDVNRVKTQIEVKESLERFTGELREYWRQLPERLSLPTQGEVNRPGTKLLKKWNQIVSEFREDRSRFVYETVHQIEEKNLLSFISLEGLAFERRAFTVFSGQPRDRVISAALNHNSVMTGPKPQWLITLAQRLEDHSKTNAAFGDGGAAQEWTDQLTGSLQPEGWWLPFGVILKDLQEDLPMGWPGEVTLHMGGDGVSGAGGVAFINVWNKNDLAWLKDNEALLHFQIPQKGLPPSVLDEAVGRSLKNVLEKCRDRFGFDFGPRDLLEKRIEMSLKKIEMHQQAWGGIPNVANIYDRGDSTGKGLNNSVYPELGVLGWGVLALERAAELAHKMGKRGPL